MTGIIEKIRSDASKSNRMVCLPEADDERILRAAVEVKRLGIAEPLLLGDPKKISSVAAQKQLDISSLTIKDSASLARSEQLAAYLKSRKRFSDLSNASLREALENSLTLACCLTATGEVDACVAGATNTTGNVISNALRIIGVQNESPLLSSFMLLEYSSPPVVGLPISLYADCAINIRPDSNQLAEIGKATALSAQRLFKLEPKIAFLSFSTEGSASHPDATISAHAARTMNHLAPDIDVIGEVQFDAALVPAVRELKMQNPAFSQPANIYIFPSLEAGNIAYKVAERIGGAQIIGPILQGLNKPMNDLSRGATVESIVNTIALTCLQVE